MGDRRLRKDGPWAFVVCAAAFISQVIGGGVQTSGLYYESFRSAFNISGVAASWLCSMAFVGWFLGSSIGSHIIKRFGCRICAFSGSFVSSLGFAMCMLATNIYTLFLFYGVLGCVGNGVAICGFYTAVNEYFEKYLNSAQTFASVGVGIGVSIYSLVYTGFIEEYGWRGALLLQAGFTLNACVLAMLLYPRAKTSQSVRKTVRYSVILKLPVLCLCLHFYFAVITESCVYVHLPVLLISKGFNAETASLSLLIFGISNIVSRAIYSIPCKMNIRILYTLNLFVGGVLLLILPLLQSLQSILVCLAVIGFTFIVYGGINLLVIRETAEHDEFVDVVAMVFLFKTVGAVTAGPIAGFLYDITDDYKFEFYFSGTIAVTACMFVLPSIMMTIKRFSGNRDKHLDHTITVDLNPDKHDEDHEITIS